MRKIFDKFLASSVWKQLLFLLTLLCLIGLLLYFLGNVLDTAQTNDHSKTTVDTTLLNHINNQELNNRSTFRDNENDSNRQNHMFDEVWFVICRLLDPGYIGQSENRFYALIITLFGWLICTGFLIAILTNAYFARIEKISNGNARYRFNNHCIILGYNQMTISLIEQILKWKKLGKNANIILLTEQDVKGIDLKLKSHIDPAVKKLIYVFRGERNSKLELQKLSIQKAKVFFISGEYDELDFDSKNIECVKLISEVLENKSNIRANKTPGYLYIENPNTFSLIQKFDLPIKIKNCLDIKVFNLQESWANRVLTGGYYENGENYLPLDYKPIYRNSDVNIRFVIVGFNRMGYALAIQAARIAHYGNKNKTIISIIDNDKNDFENYYFTQFPGISNILDIEFEFFHLSINSSEIRNKVKEWALDKNQILTIAITLKNAEDALFTGLSLPYEVYESNSSILIRQDAMHGYAVTLKNNQPGGTEGRFQNIRFFGMHSDSFNLDFNRDESAVALHNNYLQLSRNDGRYDKSKDEFLEWDDLPEQFKWSNRYFMDTYTVKIRALENNSDLFNQINDKKTYGIKLKAAYLFKYFQNNYLCKELNVSDKEQQVLIEDLELLAQIEHNRWIAERIFSGWRYGTVRDDAKRITPYIVNYMQLSEDIKMYDRELSVRIFEIM